VARRKSKCFFFIICIASVKNYLTTPPLVRIINFVNGLRITTWRVQIKVSAELITFIIVQTNIFILVADRETNFTACAAGMLVHKFCEQHPGQYRCPDTTTVPVALAPTTTTTVALAPADANICCQLDTPLCKACQHGISVEEYKAKYTNRVSTKPILLGKPDNEKYDTTANIMRALDALYIDSFLLGGSAIGAFRNNGWFHWDKDIDILVMSTGIPPKTLIATVDKILDDLGLRYSVNSFGYHVYINNTKTYIDLWLYEERKGKLQCVGRVGEIEDCFKYCRDARDHRTCIPMPKHWAYPPQQVPFGPYTMPTMHKEYLNWLYGRDWMTRCGNDGHKPCKSYHKTQHFVDVVDGSVQTMSKENVCIVTAFKPPHASEYFKYSEYEKLIPYTISNMWQYSKRNNYRL
jgi:hypothetical protein